MARMQIHVEVYNGVSSITVFSKSKRKSTVDRKHTHARVHALGLADNCRAILAALGLPMAPDCPAHPALLARLPAAKQPATAVSSVIVEAEVVPYNEANREGGRGPGIEEFWRLQAAGVSAEMFELPRESC